MAATITDLEDYRRWTRAKNAWSAAHPHPSHSWSSLSEAERLEYRRAFEHAESLLRRGRW